jgi:hypothetical protein
MLGAELSGVRGWSQGWSWVWLRHQRALEGLGQALVVTAAPDALVGQQAMKKMYKACVKYPEWKQKHQPHFKPWLHPEQSPLPSLALSELSVQHADSLENIDESTVAESREERAGGAGGEGSDDDTSLT